MTVLIAGCGDLGTEVGLQLAAAGYRVIGLRRSPDRLPAAIEGLAGDLTGPLPALPDDIDLVAYTAAAGERTEAAYRATYLDGLANVIAALARDDVTPRRLLLVSSTGVYGTDDGSWVDEDTSADPSTATGQILLAAERLLADRAAVRGIVLRLTGVYGPGRTRLIDLVREGRAVVPDPPVHTNRIHRDDAARAIVHLLTAVDEPAGLYLGTDHEPAEKGEVLRFLADELGVAHPPTGPAASSRGGNKRCRNDRLVATGFRFTFPTFREGYRAVLAGEGVRHP